jgi:hypothetical protein
MPTIDLAFVQEYEAGVHLAYQRQGSRLRSMVRYRSGVKNKTTFQKMGKGSATQKARHGDIPPMNLDHSNVNVTLEDWYAGEWIDDLDLLRVNHDEMQAAQNSGAWALGRKTDELLTTAMAATTTTHDETTNGATKAWAIELREKMGLADVPDSELFVALSWENWSQMLLIDEFIKSEYVGMGNEQLPQAQTAKIWLGMYWFPFNGLADDGNNRLNFCWHRPSVALAVGADVQSNMQYYNVKDSTFVQNKMQMNAVVIDPTAVIKMSLKK